MLIHQILYGQATLPADENMGFLAGLLISE
jgi:hypothetical protein